MSRSIYKEGTTEVVVEMECDECGIDWKSLENWKNQGLWF